MQRHRQRRRRTMRCVKYICENCASWLKNIKVKKPYTHTYTYAYINTLARSNATISHSLTLIHTFESYILNGSPISCCCCWRSMEKKKHQRTAAWGSFFLLTIARCWWWGFLLGQLGLMFVWWKVRMQCLVHCLIASNCAAIYAYIHIRIDLFI